MSSSIALRKEQCKVYFFLTILIFNKFSSKKLFKFIVAPHLQPGDVTLVHLGHNIRLVALSFFPKLRSKVQAICFSVLQ